MDRSERIATAREILALMDTGAPYLGAESRELDVDRFMGRDRFELEKQNCSWNGRN